MDFIEIFHFLINLSIVFFSSGPVGLSYHGGKTELHISNLILIFASEAEKYDFN